MDYKELVVLYESLEKTSKRLEKIDIISNFLRKVKENDLKDIICLIEGRELMKFKAPKPKFLIPLGGKYAIFIWGGHILKGFLPWFLKRLVYFKYALSILPFWKAYRKFRHSTRVFVKND